MATPLMAGLESQGIASHGPMPAGMLRIRHGSQERYVWPVHLPGWLAMGWRVAGGEGSSTGVAAVEPPAPAAVLDPAPAAESPNEPAPTRGRRGRRRKDEISTSAAAEPAIDAALQSEPGLAPNQDGARADSDADSAGGELGNQADSDESAGPNEEPGDAARDSSQETAEQSPDADAQPALTALPDDLFNDPLI